MPLAHLGDHADDDGDHGDDKEDVVVGDDADGADDGHDDDDVVDEGVAGVALVVERW